MLEVDESIGHDGGAIPARWTKKELGFPLPDDSFLLPFTGDRVYIKNPV